MKKWRKIETAPKGGIFLGCYGEDSGLQKKLRYGLFQWDESLKEYVSTGRFHRYYTRDVRIQPTHWVPLPKLPIE